MEKKQKEAEIIRDNYFKNIFDEQEKYREDLKEMLGWPLFGFVSEKLPGVSMEKLSEEDG